MILPDCKEIVDIMFGKAEIKQILNMSLSNDSVYRRILTMSKHIVQNVNEKLQNDK